MLKLINKRFFSTRPSWNEYKKSSAKYGQNQGGSGRAEYEQEIKERTERKLNWNIKNRWEQRAITEILQNQDIKQARYRDFAKVGA